MNERVVTDSTCLIGLERLGRLELLPAIFATVLAPPMVAAEFGRPPSWLVIVTPTNRPLVASLRLVMDGGEAEAFALAAEKACRIVLDDRKARRVAQEIGVLVIGTVGLLLKAKERGLLATVRPEIDALERNGFYLGPELKREALRLAGE